ncbi:MAG: suppressor of fused domain protein, partial [Bacteroidota bacterium]
FGIGGTKKIWTLGPSDQLHPDFYVLEMKPNEVHAMWTYLTVGMSMERPDDNLIELFVYSPKQDDSLVELMTVNASFHRNAQPLYIHHTVNIGRPWLDQSICDHGFISQPYLDGPEFEIFEFNGRTYRCFWFIPITVEERNYKTENGHEALEQLFESGPVDFLNPKRANLIEQNKC